MTSVREALNIVGQAASIKELAHQRNESFPLSLRNFVGALPPGRILKKVISLDFLQRKFDEFFNQRSRPLFQVRIDGEALGRSTLSVLFDDPLSETGYDKENPIVKKELAGPGEVLEFDGVVFGTHRYRFTDVRSDRLTLDIVSRQPVGIEVGLHFESEGVEMRVEGFPDIDFEGFIIKLKMEFGSVGGSLDLGFVHLVDSLVDSARVNIFQDPESSEFQAELTVSFRGKEFQATGPAQFMERKWQYEGVKNSLRNKLIKEFIFINVSVDVDWAPDGTIARQIESTMTTKIFEALKEKETRDDLKKFVTRWLVGGDFHVVGVSSDDQALSIDYIVPPGQLEPFPEEPQPPLDPGLLANIDHIVVLMMENRSFDHMLGYLSLPGGRAEVEGLRGGEKNRYRGIDFPSLPLSDTVFNESPCHRHECIEHQINGGQLDGFVADFAKHYEGVDPGRVMGYHQASHVPVYNALAGEFLICQHWFSAHPGPTFPNRFYTLTGRLNRDAFELPEKDNPDSNAFKPVFTKTIFDHLTDHGVSWHYYEQRYCFLRMFDRYTFDDNNYILDANDPVKGFFASAKAGTLPSVSFIDPNFIDEPDGQDNDDGAPADIRAGQNLVGRVVQAVMQGPKWNKTLLIITYDEHGGFYDHVNPLDPRFRDTAKPVSGIDHYGVRVPTFVISPWVDQGKVSSDVFDHTSIAKTIARRFMSANPPDMGERMAAANDLSMVLRSTAWQDRPSIPVPPEPVRNAALASPAAPVAASDDFKDVLRTMRSRYPVRG